MKTMKCMLTMVWIMPSLLFSEVEVCSPQAEFVQGKDNVCDGTIAAEPVLIKRDNSRKWYESKLLIEAVIKGEHKEGDIIIFVFYRNDDPHVEGDMSPMLGKGTKIRLFFSDAQMINIAGKNVPLIGTAACARREAYRTEIDGVYYPPDQPKTAPKDVIDAESAAGIEGSAIDGGGVIGDDAISKGTSQSDLADRDGREYITNLWIWIMIAGIVLALAILLATRKKMARKQTRV